MTTNAEHRKAMANLIRQAASALQAVEGYWESNGLPGDFSTPDNGFPFDMSLDEQVAAVWSWADKLEAVTEPDREQLDRWAHDIMALVVEDIAAHRIPMGVRTFSDLHSFVDANEYLLATPCPWGSDVGNQDDEYGVRFHNDLSDRVQVLLTATADMLAYELTLACANVQHQHTDERDPRDRRMDYQIPMTCYHCGLPAHWDETIGWYQHDQLGASCWRMEDDPKASPCKPDYNNVDLDVMVDILQRLGLHAFTEMTGGGVATVYAGKVVGSDPDLCDAPLYECCAGPGWFEGPNYSKPRATFAEFYIGRDGDDTVIDDPQPKTFVEAVQKIIALCK